MSKKPMGQPDSATKTDSQIERPPTGAKNAELTKTGLDSATLVKAESLVEKGAELELNLVKYFTSSAAIICAQGHLFAKAKSFLHAKVLETEVVDKAIGTLYAKFGLGPKTMNRRIQVWEKAVSLKIIDEDLRHKIEKSGATPELLAEMETSIGTINGTQFMRQLGILPTLEDKPKAVKVKSVKQKIDSTLETMIEHLTELINGKEFRKEAADDELIESYRAQLYHLRMAARKFNLIAPESTAIEMDSAPPLNSAQIRELEEENLRLRRDMIDAEERARALAEAQL